MYASRFAVRFTGPSKAAETGDTFAEELERFAAHDLRWRYVLELAAARLSPGARVTLGVALAGLEAGPAPALLSYDIKPDDAAAIERESAHMDPRLLTGLGLLTSARLGLGADEIAAVQGIVSAVHRLLRIAKTRP